MKKLLASMLCLALSLGVAPIHLIAAGRAIAQTNGAISGVATVDGKPLENVTVRLRNVDNGTLAGETKANAQGQFNFSGLGPGNYVVETVAANGTILGTSTAIALTATAMVVTGVTVGTSAAVVAGAGGAAAAGAAGALGTGLSTTAIVVIGTGVALGTAGVIIATNDSSPSS
jgi:hypothetical protein